MGRLSNYGILGIPFRKKETVSVRSDLATEIPPIVLPDDSKLITLAEYAPECKTVLTVHKLKYYRQRSEGVMLLPDVKVGIDVLLFDTEEISAVTL